MKLKKNLQKILICGTSLLLIGGIGAGISQISNINNIRVSACHKRGGHHRRGRHLSAKKIQSLKRSVIKSIERRIAMYHGHIRHFNNVRRHTKNRRLRRKMSLWIRNDSKVANFEQRTLRKGLFK